MTHIIEDHKLKEMLAEAREQGRKEAMGDDGLTVAYMYGASVAKDRQRAMLMRVAEEVLSETLNETVEAMHRVGRELPSLALAIDLATIVDRIAGEKK